MADRFPEQFIFGVATSAYQVEGGITNTDWNTFEEAGNIRDQQRVGQAANHYAYYAEDIALAKQLGQTAFRLSIEWARVEPQPGQFDAAAIAHYRQVLQTIHRAGMQAFVTLHHFTNPQWFVTAGGWHAPNAAERFLPYVQKVAAELGEFVDNWIIFNEPNVVLRHGYNLGIWPPALRSPWLRYRAWRQLIRAQQASYRIIKERSPNILVGLSISTIFYYPAKFSWVDSWVAHHTHARENAAWPKATKGSYDFIGVQYYFSQRCRLQLRWPWLIQESGDRLLQTDFGWDIDPAGLYGLLQLMSKFKVPLFITENGIADANDTMRASYIVQHLEQVLRAIAAGIDVRGYFHWSLLDNFEWLEGYAMRFGLVAVDFKTQQRTLRPSAKVYQTICQTKRLPVS